MKKTSRPLRRNQRSAGPILVLAAMTIIGFSIFGAWAYNVRPHSEPGDAHHSEIGEPLSITPAPAVTATYVPLRLILSLDLPPLTDEQRYWLHQVQAIPRIPIAFGVDKPPVRFTDNESVVFAALIYTECRLQPFDSSGGFLINEIGAMGCGQLMGLLLTDETRSSPEENIYAAAKEFRRLLDANEGDIMESVRNYKGSTSADTTYQANSIWDYVVIGEGK